MRREYKDKVSFVNVGESQITTVGAKDNVFIFQTAEGKWNKDGFLRLSADSP